MLKIELKTDNDFFQGNVGEATAQLIHAVADKLDKGDRDGFIYDGNGNKVGTWYLDHTDADEDEGAD